VVAAVSVAMLVAMISGIVVHARIFSDFFTFRPRAAAQRRWLDLHNLLAVLCLPFLLMIVYTGLTIKSRTYLPVPAGPQRAAPSPKLATAPPAPVVSPDLTALYGDAERVLGAGRIAFVTVKEDKGARLFVASRAFDDRLNLSTDTATFDRASGALLGTTRVDRAAYLTQRVFAGLHFGQFAGLPVRWLYFLLGLAGTAMIATGLILFSIKRPNPVVAAISTACVTGLVFACLAHLTASRFLPVSQGDREWLEAVIFFAAWGAGFGHAALRPRVKAWCEQSFAIALLAAMLALADVAALAASRPFIDDARSPIDVFLIAVAFVFVILGRRYPGMVRDRELRRQRSPAPAGA
jgi:uncharacterized iron-regulated membrane protein